MATNTNTWENEIEGFDRHQWTKRAYAFDHVIFASCARRVILQKQFGYGHLVAGTMNPVLKMFCVFLKKVIAANDAKAYFISMKAFYKFLMLIEYPTPETNEMLLLEETK